MSRKAEHRNLIDYLVVSIKGASTIIDAERCCTVCIIVGGVVGLGEIPDDERISCGSRYCESSGKNGGAETREELVELHGEILLCLE